MPVLVQLDDAGASRADQFWLDIPACVYERERSFWTALTGWEGQMEPVRRYRCGWSYGGPSRVTALPATWPSPAPTASGWPGGTPRPRGSSRYSPARPRWPTPLAVCTA